MIRCEERFRQCILTAGSICDPANTLQQSSVSAEHIHQLLSKFSPGTLERYLACIATFLEFWATESQLNNSTLEPAMLADYLLATQRSATQDRALHRTSPLTALKALRWFSRIAEWSELSACVATPSLHPTPTAPHAGTEEKLSPYPWQSLQALKELCATQAHQTL